MSDELQGRILDVQPAPGHPEGYATLVIMTEHGDVRHVVVSPEQIAALRKSIG